MTEGKFKMDDHGRQERSRFFIAVTLISFLLNGLWEMMQMPAYREMAGRPFLETVARCTPATLGDVILTFWIYAIGATAAKSLSWGFQAGWNVYLVLALIGTIHAICIEQAALVSGRWTYSEAMPVLPRLKVGLWPILQLALLPPLSVGLSKRYAVRAAGRAVRTSKDGE